MSTTRVNSGLPGGAFALADSQVVLPIESRHLLTDQQNHEIQNALATVTEALPGSADQARTLSQALNAVFFG